MAQIGTTPSLPFSGRSILSRACSREGAVSALPRAGSQALRVLLALKERPMTRHELADETGLPITTLCASIAWLKSRGLIHECGAVKGKFGVKNVSYQAGA